MCAPNSDRYEPLDDPPLQESYIVTTEEILNCSLVARLVLLSSGYGSYQFDHKDSCLGLASAFISAGESHTLFSQSSSNLCELFSENTMKYC